MHDIPIDTQHDIAQAFANQVWAFVVVSHYGGCALGIAVANEQGYCPVPHTHHKSWPELQAFADQLNQAQGLTSELATQIALSTIKGV
jgi:adenine/guanine phosphoribosyltransferase-like PRPP-binding protein